MLDLVRNRACCLPNAKAHYKQLTETVMPIQNIVATNLESSWKRQPRELFTYSKGTYGELNERLFP